MRHLPRPLTLATPIGQGSTAARQGFAPNEPRRVAVDQPTHTCERCKAAGAVIVTAGMLRDLVAYEPISGELVWRTRDAKYFRCGVVKTCEKKSLAWNGKLAGRAIRPAASGRPATSLFGKSIPLSHIAWALKTGALPRGVIDHIDGDPTNNAFANLREVSVAENNRNRRTPSTNTSGVIGVHWCKREGAWTARIGAEGRKVSLGQFAAIEDAIAARRAAERRYGYHKNHGRHAVSHSGPFDAFGHGNDDKISGGAAA